MDVLKDKVVKIRKPQKCHGCLTKFEPGSHLRYVVSVDGGDFGSAYWCRVCIASIGDNEPGDTYVPGEVKEMEWWHDNARHLPQTY